MQARSKIAKRGRDIGLDFEGEVASLRGEADWNAELQRVQDPSLRYPAYYTQPFHAYRNGNLCWEAALQVPNKNQCHLHSALCLHAGKKVLVLQESPGLPSPLMHDIQPAGVLDC